MKRRIGLALLIVAMSASTGCTKNKKRAAKLEEELARCRAAVQKLESGQITPEEKAQLATLDCDVCQQGAQP